jgi:RHS repeat-associated protein
MRLGYVYPFYYALPPSTGQTFGLSCIGAPGTPWGIACIIPSSLSSSVRQEETLWSEDHTMLGTWEASSQGLGGWTLDVHHYYDPISQMLHLGDGQRRSGETPYGVISTVAGTGSGWFSGDGGPAVLARLYNPENVAIGPDGSVYIADRSNHRIRKVDPAGIISTVAGGGSSLGDGGPATSARLSNPSDVQLGPEGSLYIADNGHRRIRRVDPAGIITTVAGTGTAGFSGDGGPATEAEIAAPRDIAVGPDGSFYISDRATHRVRRVGPDGIINTIAGTGVQGSSGDGGAAAQAQLSNPQGIDVGPDGSIYVVVNGRVRRIDPSGIITTFAGTGGTGNWGDGGPATAANVSWARDVAVAPDGSVYISQDIWYRIRRVTPDGIINTVMGTGSGTYSGDGGPATRAGGVPIGLGVARNGTLYSAVSQHRIRRVSVPLPRFSNADLALASEGGSELYEFDATGRHLRTRDATTGATLHAFDYTPDGLLSSVTDADGRVIEIERDGVGEPTAIVAPFGQRTTIALDGNGYLATLTNPANEAVTLGHTPDGLLTLIADGKGNEKHYGYDGRGRLESAEDPRGGTKTLARADGLSDYTVTVTSGLGRATAYRTEFLSTGEEERRTTGPDGLATTTTYGTDGGTTVATPDGTTAYQREGADPRWGMHAPLLQQLSVTTPGGRAFDQTAVRRATLTNLADPFSLQTELDSLRINGRVFTSLYEASQLRYTTTSATGRQSITRVDSIGRVLEQSVPGITATSYTYDTHGFLEQVGQGGRSWSYGYDSKGRLASVTDALARTDSLYYDDADRLIRQVLPNGSAILYGYDANGNLTSLTPSGRPAHGFAYDAADQDSVYAPPSLGAGSWATEYRYNLDGQLTRVIRPDAQEIGLGYDFAGRLDTLTTPHGAYSFGYSASSGQLTSVSAPGGSSLSFSYDGILPTAVGWSGPVSGSVGVSYDNNFWVTQQTVNGGNAVSFGYDNDGLLTSAGSLSVARDPQNGLITGSTLGSFATSWTYSSFGELASDTARFSSTVIYRNSYTRDDLGRITAKQELIDGVTASYTFAYDSVGRLELVTRDGLPVESYTYDANGNRLSFTSPGGTLVGSYDDQDRLLSYGDATYTYTAHGELTSKTVGSATTTYQYDVLGNLRTVTLPGGDTIEYMIDAQSRRVGKRINGSLVQGFLYQDQLNPVAELDGAGQVVSRFVYGTRPHVPDYMIEGGVTYRIVSDHLGSVRLVVNVSTGAVVQRIDYDAFGRVTQDSNPGFQPFGFAGGIYDEHTQLVRFGARDYDAFTGRWTAKDPIGFDGESPSLYVYANNDPIGLIDPDGSIAIPPILAAGILWAGADFMWQHVIQGRGLGCINWVRVAVAGGLGGTVKGVQGSVALARWAWTNPGIGYNSRLFGIGVKYTKGILNTGFVRIGWGRNVPAMSYAFRIGIGPRGTFHYDILRVPFQIGNALLP